MKVLPWSYSSLNAFEQCPRRFKLTRLTKEVVEPQTEHTLHGNAVHKSLELAIKGERPLPPMHAAYQPIVDMTKRPGKRLVEWKFALTKGFRPTEFFASDAWVRGVIDYGLIGTKQGTVLDWKTGKPKTDSDQLKLFAAVALSVYPYLEKVKTGYVWLAHQRLDSREFVRDDVSGIWQEFLPRVRRLEQALEKDDFPPRPSGLCRGWCPVGRDKCEFSEARKVA